MFSLGHNFSCPLLDRFESFDVIFHRELQVVQMKLLSRCCTFVLITASDCTKATKAVSTKTKTETVTFKTKTLGSKNKSETMFEVGNFKTNTNIRQ